MKKFLFLLPILILMSSCSTTKYSTAKSRDLYGTVTHLPVVSDLIVSQVKVKATINFNGTYTSGIRQEVIAEALKKSDADILIEPHFEVIEKGSNSSVTVTGYPGTYSSFRRATLEDMKIIRLGRAEKPDQSTEPVEVKRKTSWLWALALLPLTLIPFIK